MTPEERLARYRRRIDSVDRELARLMHVRAAVAHAVGELKRAHGMSATDTEREVAVRRNVSAVSVPGSPVTGEQVADAHAPVLALCRAVVGRAAGPAR